MIDRASSSPSSRVTRSSRATTMLLVATTVATGLGALGSWWWLLDLLAHFVVVYLLAAALGLGLCIAHQWWRRAAWALGLALLHLVRILPLFGWTMPADPEDLQLRVVSFNMEAGNPRTAEAARHIAALDPDVVALFEASRAQIEVFEAALPGYEVHALPRRDPFGIAVLCRLPLEDARVTSFGATWVPAVELHAMLGGRTISIAAVHPPPPMTGDLSRARDEVLRAVTRWAEQQPGPTLVVGDLNATPWSAIMRELMGRGSLRTTQRFGLQPSWPTWLGPLGLPIDHALASPSLHVVDRRLGRAFGSDHRLLVVELALEPSTGSGP